MQILQGGKRRRGFAALLFCLVSQRGWALPDYNVSADMGFGVPNLSFVQAEVKVWQRVQVGFGYGLLPGIDVLALMGANFPTQTFDLASGLSVSVTPKLSSSINLLSPFIRYYPKENNFYMQFSYTMLVLGINVTGTLIENITFSQVGILGGTITVIQPIPTVSVGYVFTGKRYFFNIMLGASYFMAPISSIAMNSLIPDAFGGTAANQAVLDQMQSSIGSNVVAGTQAMRDTLPVIPSLVLSVGFFL